MNALEPGQPEASVGLPVLNGGATITEALRGVLSCFSILGLVE